jgi:hypothetical protein
MASFQPFGGGLVREGLLEEIGQQPIISHRSSESDPVCSASTLLRDRWAHFNIVVRDVTERTLPRGPTGNQIRRAHSAYSCPQRQAYDKSTIPQPRCLL